MKSSWKAILLIAMGLFLFSRILSGKLFFYINERFFWLTIFAALGLLLVGISYRYRFVDNAHQHDHHDHDHEYHHHDQLSWIGLMLIASPIVLGLVVPPKPLGAAAMTNRDISIESLTSAAAPESNTILSKPHGEKNILDWIVEFRQASDPAALAGQEVKLVGFVYRDERFADETFMVSRFVVSCCAADAAPLGLVVNWPDSLTLEDDQWVEVAGVLQPGEFEGETMPIVEAASVTLTDVPDQPYLYPF
ncbi:MAG: TIGR03943 family protein [Anaerolineae bacterium]|nr:TIGR03943 family protein [Anaerolineae bacterium]